MPDLSNIEELRQACSDVVENAPTDPGYVYWGIELREFLREVRAANLQARDTEAFQRKIWVENPVAEAKQDHISVDEAIADPEFRNWLAERSMEPLPDAPESRAEALDELFDDLTIKISQYTNENKKPFFKIYRVLAGFFPSDITALSSIRKLRQLHKAMFGNPGSGKPSTHAVILRRLSDAIGTADEDVHALSERMRLPWLLLNHTESPPAPDDVAPPVLPDPVVVKPPEFTEIRRDISESGHFPEPVIRKLHYGLWANERRHFAVLTGLSGSGKTLLARSYGKAVGGESSGSSRHLCTVPVQPGWYDPSALLGYVNPLQGNSYIRTPFLEFLISASETLDRPFTVVLDEMNLSRPEQYLSPILSAMETGEPLTLHREGESFDGVPSEIRYPSNLAIIGTVNMDETTHGISDKVLDRAFTIEFWDVDLKAYPHWGMRDHTKVHEDEVRLLLTDLMKSLRPARLHFGWRVVDDVLDYMDRVLAENSSLDSVVVLDDVVYAKVLPKLRGDDAPRFREALRTSEEVLNKHSLKNCVRKVKELSDDLESTGSARFWR